MVSTWKSLWEIKMHLPFDSKTKTGQLNRISVLYFSTCTKNDVRQGGGREGERHCLLHCFAYSRPLTGALKMSLIILSLRWCVALTSQGTS